MNYQRPVKRYIQLCRVTTLRFVPYRLRGLATSSPRREACPVAYRNHSPLRGATESAIAYPTAPIKSSKIGLKLKGKVLFFDVADLTVIEAQGNYILLRRRSSCYRLRESISQLAEKLKPHGFIRIHRSVLVNASFVEEIRPQSTGQYSLRITGGKEYQVARKYKDNLRFIAQLWIGTGGSSLQ